MTGWIQTDAFGLQVLKNENGGHINDTPFENLRTYQLGDVTYYAIIVPAVGDDA